MSFTTMLSLHPLKSSFEAVLFVGIGLLAQFGPLIYQGVLLMNAPASDHPLISGKLLPTRTIPLMPTKTTVISIQATGRMPVIDTPLILFVIGGAIILYYARKFFYNKGRPPPGRPPRRPSGQSPPGGDSSGSGPPTPPPDAGAYSTFTPLPQKRGWPWFWIFYLFSTLLSLVLTWFYWPQIRKATILSIVATLSSTLLFFVGPITSTIVMIRRKIKKHLIRTRKHLLDYFGNWVTRYPHTVGAGTDVLLVLWGGLCLFAPVAACVMAFYCLLEFVPEFRQLLIECRTSIYGYYIAWFINQLTWQHITFIVGPTALIVLFKLRATHLEEHMDGLSDLVAVLIEKNQIVEQQLQALQVRAPSPSDEPKGGTAVRDADAALDDETIKGLPDGLQQIYPSQQRVLDAPDALASQGQEELDLCTMAETTVIPMHDLQVETGEDEALVDLD